eukprot:364966-Chlamydomonas_euryale.AAC.3
MMRSLTAWGRGRSAGTWIAADYATWAAACRMPDGSLTKHMLFATQLAAVGVALQQRWEWRCISGRKSVATGVGTAPLPSHLPPPPPSCNSRACPSTAAVALAVHDAVTSTPFAAKSQSLQRALTRSTPGSTALPGCWSHTRTGCTTVAAAATASTRPYHTSNLSRLLRFQRSKILNSVPPGLLVQGMFRHRRWNV